MIIYRALRSKLLTRPVSGTWLYGGLDWPSDVYFDNPSTELIEVHVIDRVLGICRRSICDERKAAMLELLMGIRTVVRWAGGVYLSRGWGSLRLVAAVLQQCLLMDALGRLLGQDGVNYAPNAENDS